MITIDYIGRGRSKMKQKSDYVILEQALRDQWPFELCLVQWKCFRSLGTTTMTPWPNGQTPTRASPGSTRSWPSCVRRAGSTTWPGTPSPASLPGATSGSPGRRDSRSQSPLLFPSISSPLMLCIVVVPYSSSVILLPVNLGTARFLTSCCWTPTGQWTLGPGCGCPAPPSSSSSSIATAPSGSAGRPTPTGTSSGEPWRPFRLTFRLMSMSLYPSPVFWLPAPRRYLPILKNFPTRYIHEPWTAPEAVQKSAKCIIGGWRVGECVRRTEVGKVYQCYHMCVGSR